MAYQMAISDEVASAVIEGYSLTRVAQQLNVSRGVIRKLMAANASLTELVLRARADKPRKRAARAGLSPHDLVTMASLYEQGDTTASLAQTFNTSVRSVIGFLRDAGADVIYTGLRRSPDYIARVAVDEDVDAVGLSILSGSHKELVEETVRCLAELDAGDIHLFVGGTIPSEDHDDLRSAGAHGIFTAEMTVDAVVAAIDADIGA